MKPKHLLSVRDLSASQIERLIETAVVDGVPVSVPAPQEGAVALIFMEPSTRTRVSFELAAKGLGRNTTLLSFRESSLSKDETLRDTLLNLQSLGCEAFVIRASAEVDIDALRNFEGGAIVNAGAGVKEHPTQALLDLATIWNLAANRSWKEVRAQKWVIVGDLKHSRVAGSWARMAKIMDLNISWVSPADWEPDFLAEGQLWSDDLEGSLKDATGVIALRVQKERFGHGESWDARALTSYIRDYQVTPAQMNVGKGLWLMHPGPVNWGIELEASLVNYGKSLIHDQVAHGLRLRSRLLFDLLHESS